MPVGSRLAGHMGAPSDEEQRIRVEVTSADRCPNPSCFLGTTAHTLRQRRACRDAIDEDRDDG